MTKKKKLIYIAGPLHGSGTVEANVKNAVEAGEVLRAQGFLTYVPHLNVLWSMIHQHVAEWWLENDHEILSRCDGLLRLPGVSPGSDSEVALCEKQGIPVFYCVHECIRHESSIPAMAYEETE